MKKNVAAALLMGCLLAASPVVAEEWVGWADIVEVYPMSVGFGFVLSESSSYNGSCYDGRFYRIPIEDPGYDQKSAAILAAFMARKQISVLAIATLPGCGAAHVDRFRIRHTR